MNVISFDGGQVLQLVALEEIRPLGALYLPSVIQEVARRYQFVNLPPSSDRAVAEGAKFQNGHIEVSGEEIIVRALDIYNDGLIVTGLTTHLAEIVMDDFANWAKQTFRLRDPLLLKPRTYVSSIVVEFDSAVETTVRKFETIASYLTEALKKSYGWEHRIGLQRLAFGADPQEIPQYRNTQFTLERRAQIPYERNRYISVAPLPTEQHLEFLRASERALLD